MQYSSKKKTMPAKALRFNCDYVLMLSPFVIAHRRGFFREKASWYHLSVYHRLKLIALPFSQATTACSAMQARVRLTKQIQTKSKSYKNIKNETALGRSRRWALTLTIINKLPTNNPRVITVKTSSLPTFFDCPLAIILAVYGDIFFLLLA